MLFIIVQAYVVINIVTNLTLNTVFIIMEGCESPKIIFWVQRPKLGMSNKCYFKCPLKWVFHNNIRMYISMLNLVSIHDFIKI
jgi:hypothetical protein